MPWKSIVVDANVAISAVIRPQGWAATQLRRPDFWLVTPSFLWLEVEAARATTARRSVCSHLEWNRRVASLRQNMVTVGEEVLALHDDDPMVKAVRTVDPKDAMYLACLIASKSDYLWTFGKALHEAFPGVAVPIIPED